MNWIAYSIIACLGTSVYVCLSKHITNSINPGNYLFLLCLTETIFFSFTIDTKSIVEIDKKTLGLIIICGAACFITCINDQLGYKVAPNPGYHVAVRAFSIVVIAGISYFLLGCELTTKAILGIILIISGIALIAIR